MRNQQLVVDKEEFLYQLIDQLDDVFWVISFDRKHLYYISASVAEVWGIPPARFYEDPTLFLTTFHPEDKDRVLADIQSQQEAGVLQRKVEQTYRILHSDGNIRWIWTRYFPLLDAHGHELAIAGLSSDITALQQAKQELAAYRDHLETLISARTAELEFANNELQQQILQRTYIEKALRKSEADLRQAMQELDHARQQLLAENIYLQERLQQHLSTEVIGQYGGLREATEAIQLVAPMDTTVLLLGETGTGKELMAQLIHQVSPRKQKPFIKVNCAAIAESLVESEIFGHEKGAFTGATSERQGRFELANGGTIFLDEVGEMPLPIQAKLLRVLQDGEFERVGGSTTIRVNVRVIAATNRDLEEAVKQGTFRQDLFYRLNVFPIQIPPLRERKQDIPELVEFFVQHYSQRMRRHIEIIPPEAIRAFQQHTWPGNVRELKNVIERAVIWSHGSELSWQQALGYSPAPTDTTTPSALISLEDMERQHIIHVLQSTDWVIQGNEGAATILNINPSTLRSKMKKLGISRPE